MDESAGEGEWPSLKVALTGQMSLSPGSPYELFGGNVRGKLESAEAPKKLVQTWQVRNPHWPSGESGRPTRY